MSLAEGLTLTVFALPGGRTGRGVRLRDFVVAKQDLGSWCWASVAVAIHKFYTGQVIDQCTLATAVLPGPPSTCCPFAAHDGDQSCDRTLDTGTALQNHLAPPPVGNSAPFATIQAEIPDPVKGHPIACTLQAGQEMAGAHAVVITGWAEVPLLDPTTSQDFVYFYNPTSQGEHGWVSYSTFVHDGEVNWVETYLTKAV